MPFNMKVAMYSGLLSSNLLTLPSPPFSCPSGNCTWDPFGTLSVSAACSDITSSMNLNCSSSAGGDTPRCNLVSPNDTLLAEMLNGTTDRTFIITDAYLTRAALVALKPYANITAAMGLVQWARVTNITAYPNSVDAIITPNATYEAGRCLFYFAVREIRAQVSNGIYDEQVLQEYTHIPNATAPPTYTLNGTDYYFRDPWEWEDNIVFSPPFTPNTNFTVPWADFDIFSSAFTQGDFLVGNVTSGSSSGFEGPSIPLMLMSADNVTRAMENMAQYMTTALRSNDTQLLEDQLQNASVIAPNQSVKGAVWVETQFVTIRWGWLALPCVTIVLTIIFLTIVILRTWYASVGIWKSSPLALFFQAGLGKGLPAATLIPREVLATADGMQEAAAGINAQAISGALGGIEISVR